MGGSTLASRSSLPPGDEQTRTLCGNKIASRAAAQVQGGLYQLHAQRVRAVRCQPERTMANSRSAEARSGVAYLAIGDQTHALESLELAAQKAANHELDEGFIILLALQANVTNDPVLK